MRVWPAQRSGGKERLHAAGTPLWHGLGTGCGVQVGGVVPRTMKRGYYKRDRVKSLVSLAWWDTVLYYCVCCKVSNILRSKYNFLF